LAELPMHGVFSGPPVVALLALALSGVAAVYDLRVRRIPSWLTLPAIATGPALHVALAFRMHAHGALGLSGPTLGASLSLVGAFACAVVPLCMWRMGLMGGGDWKLLASSGALLGAPVGIRVELVALLLAGYFGLARLAFRGQLLSTLGGSLTCALQLLLPGRQRREAPPAMLESVLMGPFVLAGTIVVLLLPLARQHSALAELSHP
jgi:prepilin peptidase CpaA